MATTLCFFCCNYDWRTMTKLRWRHAVVVCSSDSTLAPLPTVTSSNHAIQKPRKSIAIRLTGASFLRESCTAYDFMIEWPVWCARFRLVSSAGVGVFRVFLLAVLWSAGCSVESQLTVCSRCRAQLMRYRRNELLIRERRAASRCWCLIAERHEIPLWFGVL